MSKQHQKSEGLSSNREELAGKKLPFQQKIALSTVPSPGMEPRTLGPGNLPLSYQPVPRYLCNKGFTGLTWYGKKSPPCENFGWLRHAAACFKTPTNSSQNLALRHAAAVGACGVTNYSVTPAPQWESHFKASSPSDVHSTH